MRSLFSFFLFFILCLCTNAYITDSLPPQQMPQPWGYSSEACRPRGTSSSSISQHFVCDPSGLLSPRQTSRLEKSISKIYDGEGDYSLVKCPRSRSHTSNDAQQGFIIAIALIRRMPFDGNTLEQRATSYADNLFSHWELSHDCGASVLILVSLQDQRLYIATGKLANRYLSNKQIYNVYDKMVPLMKQGKVYKALLVAVGSIGRYLRKYKGTHSPPARHTGTGTGHGSWRDPLFFKHGPLWWDLLMSVAVIGCAFMLLFACCNGTGGLEASRKKKERRYVRRKLDIIRREYIAAMLPGYTPITCPMCHDDLTPPWEPTIPTLPPAENEQLVSQEEGVFTPPRRTRTLRCGHTFHENCFEDEANTGHEANPTTTTTAGTACPLCGDPGMGTSQPRSLSDTRQEDVAFRLRRLGEEYPHILTQDVIEKLSEETPNLWPEQMTDTYMRPSWGDYTRQMTGEGGNNAMWNSVRTVLGGLAIGSIFYGIVSGLGGLFSGGNNNDNRSYYTDITSSGGDGPASGAGMGWGNSLSNAASRFTGGGGPAGGLGFGWGGNNGRDDGPSSGTGLGW